MLDLGSEIFYLEPKTKKIREGILIGANITETGYKIYAILTKDNRKVSFESAHVYASREHAEFHKDNVTPIIEQAELEAKKANEIVDNLRIQVIGKPIYKELADRIMNKPIK